MALVHFWVLRLVLGGLENQRFKGLLWVAYTLALVTYITWLLARFDAFWRHCGGGVLGGLASRENLTIKTRDAGAQCAGARAGACVHDVRGCAGACVCVYVTPPFIFLTSLFLEAIIFIFGWKVFYFCFCLPKKMTPPLKRERSKVSHP